jgi:ankyrin repeat protein
MTAALATRTAQLILISMTFALALPTVTRGGYDLVAPTPAGKPRFDVAGAQVGEQLPNLQMYDLEGKPAPLSHLWNQKPVLLLTSSYTCPKSRSTYPDAAALAEKLKGKIDVAIIYVIEAHPKGDPSPYKGVEDVTPENLRDHILCRQPATLAQRIELAGQFKRRLNVTVPIYIDAMNNAAWKNLGGGPNMAILVREGGIVALRQGWFDKPSMEKLAERVWESEPKWIPYRDRAKPEMEVKLEAAGTSWSAVMSMFRNGDLAECRSILKKFPELATYTDPFQERGSSGAMTLLHYAVEGKQPETVELLVASGAEINAQNVHTASPLHLAAGAGNREIVNLLLKHGADVNLAAPQGPTPLQEALIHNHPEVARVLLDNGAKANFFSDAGLGNLDSLRKQLNADATRAVRRDGLGRTPLAYAAAGGQIEAAKLLMSFGARDERPKESTGELALHWAIRAHQAPMVQFLLDSGGDANAGTWSHPNLHLAIYADAADIVKILLEHHADPNAPSLHGEAPLHWAASLNQSKVVQALLSAGAKVDVRRDVDHSPCGSGDTDLETPLHYAAHSGSIDAVRLLIDHGADVNAKDIDNETPLDLAMKQKTNSDKHDPAAVEFLASHGGLPGNIAPGAIPTRPKRSGFDRG